jgi:hypothetical protein
VGTADAVAREAAWLQSSGDGLPALLTADGGPWDIVQAYWRRTPPSEKTAIYVLRASLSDERTANIRIRTGYDFTLKLHWPVRQAAEGLAEKEQQAMDDAVDLLIQRIRGPLGDKTHGGRFLSAGEVPRMPGVHVAFDDPELTIASGKALRALVSYPADDFEIND